MGELPVPEHYDPRRVSELFIERTAKVAEGAAAYALRHGIAPAATDTLRIAALGVDLQVAFCVPGASLFVPGAVEDTQRALGWLYRNLDRISALYLTLDTHRLFQIFHPSFWVDSNGAHPAPFTPIFHEQVRGGRWTPVAQRELCLEYTRKLERAGKYVLTIWPYHALLGGISHALVPAVAEAAIFHSVARAQQTHFELKGTHPLTENYSVLRPEVTELGGQLVGAFNTTLFNELMEYDRVYIFGQAKSHCVLWTLKDLRERIEQLEPGLLGRIYILQDAMSPVSPPAISPLPPALDFPKVANREMEELQRAGMHVVSTRDSLPHVRSSSPRPAELT